MIILHISTGFAGCAGFYISGIQADSVAVRECIMVIYANNQNAERLKWMIIIKYTTFITKYYTAKKEESWYF